MATITAQMVKDLRNRTDLPMMECKQALTECNGEIDNALEWLRKKHKGKMSERSDRITGEGRIAVYIDESHRVGAIIELQCETAPVAKNDLFVELADAFAKRVACGSEASPDPESIRNEPELDAMFTNVFGRLREAMKLGRCVRIEGGFLASYIHHDGKSGVLLSLDKAPQSDKNVAGDLCMHALFTNPVAIDRSGVADEAVEKVRSEAREAAQAEGKPEGIVDKIAEGKVNAFYGQSVLLEQLHIKTDDYGKKKVGDVLKEAGVGGVTDVVVIKLGA